jgi:hypothetical protein
MTAAQITSFFFFSKLGVDVLCLTNYMHKYLDELHQSFIIMKLHYNIFEIILIKLN